MVILLKMNKTIVKHLWVLVYLQAEETNCKDRQVGCVIYNTKLNEIVGKGINTHPDGVCDCSTTKTAIHAEVNAVNSMQETFDRKDLIAFISHAPCCNCTQVLSTTVSEVRYRSQK